MKLKILLLGPVRSGKSAIANSLCDLSVNYDEYRPTQGVRIVECEHAYLMDSSKTEVEVWDTSGDHKFEPMWPAFQRDSHGVIFVFNSSTPSHVSELLLFYDYFITQSDLNNHKCLVIDNLKNSSDSNLKLPRQLASLPQKKINVKTEGDVLKKEFNQLVSSLIRAVHQTGHSDFSGL